MSDKMKYLGLILIFLPLALLWLYTFGAISPANDFTYIMASVITAITGIFVLFGEEL